MTTTFSQELILIVSAILVAGLATVAVYFYRTVKRLRESLNWQKLKHDVITLEAEQKQKTLLTNLLIKEEEEKVMQSDTSAENHQSADEKSGKHSKVSFDPTQIWTLGIADAIKAYCDLINQQPSNTSVSFENTVGALNLSRKSALRLFKVVQELINNALRHAQANNVSVTLENRADKLVLAVSDNGRGFDVQEHNIRQLINSTNGYAEVVAPNNLEEVLGLQQVESRVQMMDGLIEFNSQKGVGTTITVELDLNSVSSPVAA
ncbi:MAG: ATP-binding protein [Bacteroidota bacterium]